MGERINIQNLIDLLAEKRGLTKKESEHFLKEMFNLVEEALEKEKYLKIKGFGTFKLIAVDSRESVNVNTGARIEIQGHTKISFTPEASIRDQINRPFSHFETVVLNEGTVFDDMSQSEDSSDNVDAESVQTYDDDYLNEESQLQVVKEVLMMEDSFSNDIEEYHVKELLSEETEKVAIIEKTTVSNLHDELYVSASSDLVSVEQDMVAVKTLIDDSSAISIDAKKTDEVRELDSQKHLNDEQFVQPFIREKIKNNEDLLSQNVANNVELDESETLTESKAPLIEDLISAAKAQSIATQNYGRDYTLAYFITVIFFLVVFLGGIFTYIYSPDFVMRILSVPVEEQKGDTLIAKADTVSPKTIPMVDSLASIKDAEKELLKDTTNTIISGIEDVNATNQPDSIRYAIVGTMEIYKVKAGEGLIKISKRFYNSKNLWPYIIMHNPKIKKNPNNVSAGTVLKIPALRDK